ncbi:TIGR02680 family protein [Geobacillus thermoleovorans]|uniref:TIGR02680 family protein n=1 Tax=Geobacillus thermoleovorans TaxID=33941 RepID=UPI00345BCC9C
MANPWVLHRAGLINFWYYDEQYFYFADGKLLLRGSNGAGKSVTMQSLIPVLLDGKKTPDRLDPFGSRARRMEDYLLGEKDVVDRDERTGYLFLEYKRKESDQYVTTGIGLRAKRQKSLDFWGFVIFDNRRIGHDITLYKKEKTGEKIPLTKRELAATLGAGGTVVETQKDYMELVNKHVFRFESLGAFQELIELLIQLRSPKLSKDFKPTVIYEILESSLPPLTDDELRHLSETIENMDQAKQQLEQLERDERSLKRLCDQYRQYNEYMIAEKAVEYEKAAKQAEQLAAEQHRRRSEEEQAQKGLAELDEKITSLRREEDVLRAREIDLAGHEVFRQADKCEELKAERKRLQERRERHERAIEEKERIERQHRRRLDEAAARADEIERALEDELEQLRADAEEGAFSSHAVNEDDFLRHRRKQQEFLFAAWKREADLHIERLEELAHLWRRHDDLKGRYEEASKEAGELQREVDEWRHQQRKWDELLEQEKERFEQQVLAWLEREEIEVSEADIQAFLRQVSAIYERYSIDDIKRPFAEAYYAAIGKKNDEKWRMEHEIRLLDRELVDREAELRHWRDERDPEPERDEQTAAARAELKRQGVAFVPFYAAVEFVDHVPENVRERIESALSHAGLLDALIADRDVDVVCDRVLIPNPVHMAHTLADYLRPDADAPVSAERIDDVLRSIVITDAEQEGGMALDEAGRYAIGLLRGHAPVREQAMFIGRTARERWRMEKIAALEEEIAALRRQRDRLRTEHESVEAAIAALADWFAAFPSDRDVRTAFEEREEARRQAESKERDWKRQEEKAARLAREWQQLKQTLREQSTGLNVEFSLDGCEQARLAMKSYVRHLHELEVHYREARHIEAMITQQQERLAALIEEIDEAKGERNRLLDEEERLALRISEMERTLAQMGADDIRAEIARIRERLAALRGEIPRLVNERARTEQQLAFIRAELEKGEKREAFARRLAAMWEESFAREAALGLVELDRSRSLPEQAKEAKQRYGAVLKETLSSLLARLNTVFFQESSNLTEYRATLERLPDDGDHEWITSAPDDEMAMKAADWREKQERHVIFLDYKGQRATPFAVLAEVERDIVLQHEYMKEQDRELYEDVILKSVGRILRSRIQRAERWVSDMNKLMGGLDTSSGLVLSIQWKPKTAETEAELDTKELVRLLRIDPRLLKEEDLQRVTNHFRSKIARARELLEERGQGNTLHQIIKEVLDYRKWFAFTLYYEKANEPKRELTNHRFYQFSGGEKAMAMYIPLFAAAYSRYQEAGDDAPYIISLDEAFAGVDENNIRNLFGLVEQLGFNYIMNSQALWGDYDTVPALSICELVRPRNASFVTVIHYRWNGRVKQLVTDDEEWEMIET